MTTATIKYRDWIFEVDQDLTRKTYQKTSGGGADGCLCRDCKNYVASRHEMFPEEIKQLFDNLGINYSKEVEIISYEKLQNKLHHIGGWFHFKGRVVSGKDYRIPLPNGGYNLDLVKINDNFSIGFSEGSDLIFFEDKVDLVQIEFDANIPWVVDKHLETE